jgi:DNA-binding GntR family transcriptional regulator
MSPRKHSEGLPLLKKAKPVSVAEQAASTLRDAILSGQFKPGDRLVERHVADAVGVSLASIRDALQQLHREGLVNRTANTATYVTDLSPARFKNMIDVRLLLEPTAMVLACRNITPININSLQLRAAEIKQLVTNNDFYHVSRADFAFHQEIWQISGNETLERMLTQLCTPIFAFLMIVMSAKRDSLGERIVPHQPLVDALKSRNEKEVDAYARAHILSSMRNFPE